jgi:hypothetical protein
MWFIPFQKDRIKEQSFFRSENRSKRPSDFTGKGTTEKKTKKNIFLLSIVGKKVCYNHTFLFIKTVAREENLSICSI